MFTVNYNSNTHKNVFINISLSVLRVIITQISEPKLNWLQPATIPNYCSGVWCSVFRQLSAENWVPRPLTSDHWTPRPTSAKTIEHQDHWALDNWGWDRLSTKKTSEEWKHYLHIGRGTKLSSYITLMKYWLFCIFVQRVNRFGAYLFYDTSFLFWKLFNAYYRTFVYIFLTLHFKIIWFFINIFYFYIFILWIFCIIDVF